MSSAKSKTKKDGRANNASLGDVSFFELCCARIEIIRDWLEFRLDSNLLSFMFDYFDFCVSERRLVTSQEFKL